MKFIPHTQNELKNLDIKENNSYKIEYLNRDYFNGDENIEQTFAKAVINEEGIIMFLVQDDYGMDKFIKDVKIIK